MILKSCVYIKYYNIINNFYTREYILKVIASVKRDSLLYIKTLFIVYIIIIIIYVYLKQQCN